MSGIRGKNTKPEVLVRKAIFAEGLRFRIHRKDIPGNPDIVLSGKKVLIFVHGCFWHQHKECRYTKMPASNVEFWQKKLNENSTRDRKIQEELNRLGWRVLIIWECATRDRSVLEVLGHVISKWVEGNEIKGSIPEIRDLNGVRLPKISENSL